MTFPDKIYVRVPQVNQPLSAHAEIAEAAPSRLRTRIAEYKLVRVVETKMVADIQCEVGNV